MQGEEAHGRARGSLRRPARVRSLTHGVGHDVEAGQLRLGLCHVSERLAGRLPWARSYLDRNQDIVDRSDVLLAAPKEWTDLSRVRTYEELLRAKPLRSGTWSTVRRAYKRRIPIIIVFPNGSTFLLREEQP